MLDADDELDALKTQVFRELLTYMLHDPATIEPSLDLILISRHLERIGDHATNIAEDVIFMVSARTSGTTHIEALSRIRLAEYRSRMPDSRAIQIQSKRDGRRCRWCVYCRRQPVDPKWRPFCSERCKMADLGPLAARATTACPADRPYRTRRPDERRSGRSR